MIKATETTRIVTPSKYQQSILEWATDPTQQHGICNAVAGSGKSTTLKMVAIELMNNGYHPNDITIVVFGKQNQLDLQDKFGRHWKESIHTLHLIGYQILSLAYGKIKDVDSRKYHKIAKELGYIGTKKHPGKLLKNKAIGCESQFMKLFSLVRLSSLNISYELIKFLVNHYNLDEIHDINMCQSSTTEIIKIGQKLLLDERIIDYDDMICLPVSLVKTDNMGFFSNKFVLVDECQDLNPMQLQLALSLIGNEGRALFVGDPSQAIYGFSGADNDSYYKIKEATEAKELPLSICYRCPKSHIALVNETFPDIPIKASKDASYGVIKQIVEDEAFHESSDLILSRKTAPLVSYCLRLIGQGISAKVKGRDIGNQLVKEVKAIYDYGYALDGDNSKFERFLIWMVEYRKFKECQWHDLEYKDRLAEILDDKLNAIRVIFDSLTCDFSIEGLIDKIKSLFSDGSNYVTLCTVHRAKGMESNRVFILEPDDMPLGYRKQQPWEYEQELNLLYVALTRSKNELYLIGKAGWLREGRLT